MAKETIGGTKLKETFGAFLAVKPTLTQEVLLYPPHEIAMNQETMTQTTRQTRRKPRRNSSSQASIPPINSILLTKKYRNHIVFVTRGQKSLKVKREPYHILILNKNNVVKINPLKLKEKLSNYLVITIEPSSEFYDRIRKHFNNGKNSLLVKKGEINNG